MAERRMFSKAVVDSDRFLDMALSAQALYFHLGVHADDDGFIANPKKIQRAIRANDGDFKELMREGYVIAFDTGVIVITHWKMNNFIRSDRYKPTTCQEEKNQLVLLENGTYGLASDYPHLLEVKNDPKPERLPSGIPVGIPDGIPGDNQVVAKWDTQVSIGKDSIDKISIDKDNKETKASTNRKRFSPPSIDEIKSYCLEKGYNLVDAEYFWNYYENVGWKIGKNKMKNWKLAVANWQKRQEQFSAAKEKPKAEIVQHTQEELDESWGWE